MEEKKGGKECRLDDKKKYEVAFRCCNTTTSCFETEERQGVENKIQFYQHQKNSKNYSGEGKKNKARKLSCCLSAESGIATCLSHSTSVKAEIWEREKIGTCPIPKNSCEAMQ